MTNDNEMPKLTIIMVLAVVITFGIAAILVIPPMWQRFEESCIVRSFNGTVTDMQRERRFFITEIAPIYHIVLTNGTDEFRITFRAKDIEVKIFGSLETGTVCKIGDDVYVTWNSSFKKIVKQEN